MKPLEEVNTTRLDREEDPARMVKKEVLLVALFFLLPVLVFNSYELWPEIRSDVPNVNDEGAHFVYVNRANDALVSGENPTDHWEPQLEVGHGIFFFYQHLPHLAVVLIFQALGESLDLFLVFNLVRYLLLITFPLTVYWAMRRMSFRPIAAGFGAAAASFLSANPTLRSFHYSSYVWRGHGLFTQIWAMHFAFLALAAFYKLRRTGRGHTTAILMFALVVLVHLEYAFISGFAAALTLLTVSHSRWPRRIIQLAIVGTGAAVVTSYLWLPIAKEIRYFNSPSAFSSEIGPGGFDARDIFGFLVSGDLFDYGRLPILTVLVAIGGLAAILTRKNPYFLSLNLFVLMFALFLGRSFWGPIGEFLQGFGVYLHRFVGGVDIAAILLIGTAGGWLWEQTSKVRLLPDTVQLVAYVLILLVPTGIERHNYYLWNGRLIQEQRRQLTDAADVRAVLNGAKEAETGRSYAGVRRRQSESRRLGFLHIYDLLAFQESWVLAPPYQGFSSLNADMTFLFEQFNRSHYELFNVTYAIGLSGSPMPEFLLPVVREGRFTGYQAPGGGFAMFVDTTEVQSAGSHLDLFHVNREWLRGSGPSQRKFIKWIYPSEERTFEARESIGNCVSEGSILSQKVQPSAFEFVTSCSNASTLLIKTSFHPNWEVTVDGFESQTLMLSPAFLGVELSEGRHVVRAEYRSPLYRSLLLLFGMITVLLLLVMRGRILKLEDWGVGVLSRGSNNVV